MFQAVQEFLVVREPKRLVFVAKAESIGKIYETYLFKQEGALAELGYRTIPPVKASPFVEFRIEKTTSSTWNN